MNRLPVSSASPIRPPCRATAQRAIASPSPVPPPPAAAGAAAVEAVEDPVPVGRCDARAVVGDLQVQAVRAGPRGHPHGAAGRAVPRGVVEQVGEHLVQPGAVGPGHGLRRRHVDREPDVAPGHRGLRHRRLEHLGHRDVTAVQRLGAGVDPGQVQQLAHQPAEPLGLRQRDLQGGRVRVGHAVDQVLQDRVQRRDRRPQLVADVRDELAPVAVGGLEVGGHPVEGAGQLADLVPRGVGHPAAVVATSHGARGGRHRAQRRGHAAGQHLGDAECQQHGHRERVPRAPVEVDQAVPDEERRHGHRDDDQHAELGLDRAQRVERARGAPSSHPPRSRCRARCG